MPFFYFARRVVVAATAAAAVLVVAPSAHAAGYVQEHGLYSVEFARGLQTQSIDSNVTVKVSTVVPRCTRASALTAEVYQEEGSYWVRIQSDPARAAARNCRLQGMKMWSKQLTVPASVATSLQASYGLA